MRLLKKKYEESYEITVIIADTNSKSPIDISLLLEIVDYFRLILTAPSS